MSKQFLFNSVPTIHRRRAKFNLSHKLFTSLNVGDLAPVYVQEVYAGDDFKIDSAFISRLSSSFVRPVMDSLYLDQMFFFVPSRLLYDKFVNVMGESEGAWAPSKTYSVPCVRLGASTTSSYNGASSNQVYAGTVADYMGIPVGTYSGAGSGDTFENLDVSLLPFRAFAMIYNDWFRDENVEQPMLIHKGDSYAGGPEALNGEGFNNDAWSPANYTGKLPKVSKMHDYFTSALPAPQKGSAQGFMNGLAPVFALDKDIPITGNDEIGGYSWTGSSPALARMRFLANNGDPNGTYAFEIKDTDRSVGGPSSPSYKKANSIYPTGASVDDSGISYTPLNLWADLNGSTVDINDLRTAAQVQRLLERDARGGTRYIEYIRSAFGVDAGDYRLQRPEYLGGKRTPLQVQQVPQTSASVKDGEALGTLSAYSLSFGRARARKGFTEHGYIIGVACIRQHHTYQQGIEKFWFRKERTDFYDPVFQSLGEQPIKQAEIFATSMNSASNVFGYQEAWADLRQRPNRVTGALRSAGDSVGFDVYHFADDYAIAPVLNSAFIKESEDFVNRTLAVPHTTFETSQFVMEFDFKVDAVRCLPGRSVPGLLDHN